MITRPFIPLKGQDTNIDCFKGHGQNYYPRWSQNCSLLYWHSAASESPRSYSYNHAPKVSSQYLFYIPHPMSILSMVAGVDPRFVDLAYACCWGWPTPRAASHHRNLVLQLSNIYQRENTRIIGFSILYTDFLQKRGHSWCKMLEYMHFQYISPVFLWWLVLFSHLRRQIYASLEYDAPHRLFFCVRGQNNFTELHDPIRSKSCNFSE